MEATKMDLSQLKNTIRLYDEDAYATKFTAKVLAVKLSEESNQSDSNNNEKKITLILDQTMFFPEEGGQSCDRGLINGFPVVDVQLKQGIIIHTLEMKEPQPQTVQSSLESQLEQLQPGKSVCGEIDWAFRFSNMQNHTGEHILSGLIHKKYKYDNVGFHLSPQSVTMDMNGTLSEEELAAIEQEANNAVYQNVSVQADYPSKEVLSALDYRSKIDIDGPVRIVTIDGYDICACCAPHVSRTGEIGLIKIIKSENYKGGIRLSILCGQRALEYVKAMQETTQAIARKLSAKPEQLTQEFERLLSELGQYKATINELKRARIEEKVEALKPSIDATFIFESELEPELQREYVNLLGVKCSGSYGVFVGDDTLGYRYIIASEHEDLRVLQNILKTELHAKGGGKPEMIQGQVLAEKQTILTLINNRTKE
jgi:alanyl-tRNA synthetase